MDSCCVALKHTHLRRPSGFCNVGSGFLGERVRGSFNNRLWANQLRTDKRKVIPGAVLAVLTLKDAEAIGRYDMCCPMMSAWDLHKAWPEADFKVIPDAGHSANQPGIAAELVAATEKLKHIKKGQWEDRQKFVPENKQQSSHFGCRLQLETVHACLKSSYIHKEAVCKQVGSSSMHIIAWKYWTVLLNCVAFP
ncbi:hypothetical protein C1H46_011935 [Malus baccata]|uniref:Uncharacterized protein n=1 Tax=Malus baccata TaxID=106549 RepID=A0A540MVM4_MALBA|nr:hypothetical protein C1H46_011935 [Malus baccata]